MNTSLKSILTAGMTLHPASIASVAEVYLSPDRGEKPCAVAFFGKRGKPSWSYSFQTGEKREAYAGAWLARMRQNAIIHAENKAQAKAQEKAFRTTLVEGDILMSMWGYDQTNIDYFQVTAVSATGKTVTVREIGKATITGTAPMAGECTPARDDFRGEPRRCSVRLGEWVCLGKGHSAQKWSGRPNYWSSYG